MIEIKNSRGESFEINASAVEYYTQGFNKSTSWLAYTKRHDVFIMSHGLKGKEMHKSDVDSVPHIACLLLLAGV